MSDATEAQQRVLWLLGLADTCPSDTVTEVTGVFLSAVAARHAIMADIIGSIGKNAKHVEHVWRPQGDGFELDYDWDVHPFEVGAPLE